MKTFDRYFADFETFLDDILRSNPRFVVPVAKKGAKLLRLFPKIGVTRLRYLAHFEYFEPDLRGVKIAVVDDATQHTSALSEHRKFFERRGAEVDTYSFVGHDQLFEGSRWMYDTRAHIHHYLPEALYQEYVLQEAAYFQGIGNHFDIDHLIYEAEYDSEEVVELQRALQRISYVYTVDDPTGRAIDVRFAADQIRSFGRLPFIPDPGVSTGPIRKIKFSYIAGSRSLAFAPLVFPTWRYGKTPRSRALLREVPFRLPVPISPAPVSTALERRKTYFNLSVAYQVGLLRAVAQISPAFRALMERSAPRPVDLTAILGENAAAEFQQDVRAFVLGAGTLLFENVGTKPRRAHRSGPPLRTFADVIDHLRGGYQEAVRQHKRRTGVHYYLTYERLFAQADDALLLSEQLDQFCDVGAIVPAVVDKSGVLARGCRSGEPDSDRAWTRTQLLVPLAISQLAREAVGSGRKIGPTVLNKAISCFQYDYPQRVHPTLHCFHGEPGRYGTMVHVFDPVRAAMRPTLYDAKHISPFYRYDKQIVDDEGTFEIANGTRFLKELPNVFDDRDEIPYAEIVAYFRFLGDVYRAHGRVDVLNALSICRDEKYFFAHLRHNITAASTHLSSYATILVPDREALRAAKGHSAETRQNTRNIAVELNDALIHARSAEEKVGLAEAFDDLLETVVKPLGSRVEYIKIVERMIASYIPYSEAFKRGLQTWNLLAQQVEALAAFALAVETGTAKAERELLTANADARLAAFGVSIASDLSTYRANPQAFNDVFRKAFEGIQREVAMLPEDEPLLESRIERHGRRRARNLLTAIAYERNLRDVTLLFADFSGLRDLPEPKDAVLSLYYDIAEGCATKAGGRKLYGGSGGDDSFTWLFDSERAAITAAFNLSRAFAENLLLADYGVKFGLCSTTVPEDDKEDSLIKAWGFAKDCCTYKSSSFLNRNDVVLTESSIAHMTASDRASYRFDELKGEGIGPNRSERIFRVVSPTT